MSLFFRDLSQINGLKNVIIDSFNHTNEEVKSAASYALGNISLGNLDSYVPFVLKEIETQPKRQYLLLHSLKEIISAQSSTPSGVKVLAPYVPAIWTQLFNHCECSEEGMTFFLQSSVQWCSEKGNKCCLNQKCVAEDKSAVTLLSSWK